MQRANTLHRVSNRESTMSFNEEAALGVLTFLEKEQLQGLNDNEDKLDDLVSDLQQVNLYIDTSYSVSLYVIYNLP